MFEEISAENINLVTFYNNNIDELNFILVNATS